MTQLFKVSQAHRIILIAMDCGFISSDDKDALTRRLDTHTDPSHPFDIYQILLGDEFIDDQQLDDLKILESHLAERDMDLLFGRLAFANGFCSKDEVVQGLACQAHKFDKRGEHKKLGDVMVSAGMITAKDCVSILLTQNRIKEENLACALGQLGDTAEWETTLNRRFCALAVTRKGVDIQKVNQALARQQRPCDQGKTHGFIGEIMVEMNLLSNAEVTDILMEIKQCEKRRMDLENALYTVKEELRIVEKLNRLFRYSISRDGLELIVDKQGCVNESISVYEILIWLRRAGIRYGIVGDSEFGVFLKEDKDSIIAAKGVAAINGGAQTVKFLMEPCKEGCPTQDAARVKTGDILAEILPGIGAKYGKNVFGSLVKPDPPTPCGIDAGTGVTCKGDGFIAGRSGCLYLIGGTTLMVRSLEKQGGSANLTGSVDADTHDKYQKLSVSLSGTVGPDGVLRCRTVIVKGRIEGKVQCLEDIHAKGDIGNEKTKIQDRFQTRISCGGNFYGSGTIIHAQLEAEGRVIAPDAWVIASRIIAHQGIVLNSVLSDGDGVSILYFGLFPGDKRIALDDGIQKAQALLSSMKKEKEIIELDEWYDTQAVEIEKIVLEQSVISTLIEIIDGPELYQYERIEDKVRYLEELPDYSSIKQFYWKIPDDPRAESLLADIIRLGEKDSLGTIRSRLKLRQDKDRNVDTSPMGSVGVEYQARRNALENEIEADTQRINEIRKTLETLRVKRGKVARAVALVSGSGAPVIQVKNKCAKGTVIRGRYAQLILETTQYQVSFKEIVDPDAGTAEIVIDTCW